MEELRDLLHRVRHRLSSSSQQGQSLQVIRSAEESLGLLGTNDDPIKTEELLRGPLNQCQTLLYQKRLEIADLRCRLGVLEEEERDLANIAEKTKGLFSYIRHCPSEIIGEIFLNCVDFYHSTDKPEDDFHASVHARLIHPDNAPLLLLRICKKWQQIALNTPKLFTQLYLSQEMIEGGEEMDRVLDLFLTCSGSLTLDVFFQARMHHRFSYGIMVMVSAQLPCFSRIYRIRVSGNLLSRLFPPWSCTDTPALLDFRLYGDMMTAFDRQFGRLVAPKLKVFLSPLNLNFDWGRFITLGECLEMFSGFYTWEKLHQLFQNSSNMEYCRIECYTESPELELECDAPIFLPRLRDLSISASSSQIGTPLLSQLMMPSLRALQLDANHTFNGDEVDLGGIISSFNSVRPSLETLLIDGAIIQREDFHNLLRILPELTTMTLRDCAIRGALRALNLDYEPDVCPKLATLDLKGSLLSYSDSSVAYEEDIISIIRSRARPRSSTYPGKRTQRALCYMNLLLNLNNKGYLHDLLEEIRRVGNEYDIVITQKGNEEEETEWG